MKRDYPALVELIKAIGEQFEAIGADPFAVQLIRVGATATAFTLKEHGERELFKLTEPE
jgi:hypothetical protein